MSAQPPAYSPGLSRYKLRRNSLNVVAKVLPPEPDLVHALPVRTSDRTPLDSPHYFELHHDRQAVCGARVLVMMPGSFDPGDPQACQRCADEVFSARRS